jgi:hypothetical protein
MEVGQIPGIHQKLPNHSLKIAELNFYLELLLLAP